MWKILIADDEPHIRAGLKDMIEGFPLHAEVCGEARNGIQAWEIIQKEQPHIVLADISMPKLNGLDLIEKVRQAKLETEVIIITGHDEFDYARKAIHLRVSNYLLKPINETELYESVRQLLNKLHHHREKSHRQQMLDEQVRKNKAYLRQSFFREWIAGTISAAERVDQSLVLGIELPPYPALLLASAVGESVDRPPGELVSGSTADDRLECRLAELLEAYRPYHIFHDEQQNVLALLNCREDQLEELSACCRAGIGRLGQGRIHLEVELCSGDLPFTYRELQRRTAEETSYTPLVKAAKAYITQHYSNNRLDLILVAEAIGSNPSYLSRLMKKELGLSFKDYLTKLRIQKAVGLIRNSTDTINEIAEQVGYSSQHYFSTSFKNIMGMAPSEYRRRLTG